MSSRILSTALSLAVVPFFACGGDSKTVDSGLVLHDSPNGSGSGSGSGSAGCAAMASYSPTFNANNSAAINAGSDAMASGFTQHNVFVGLLGSAQTDPVLQIDILGGAGATNSPDWPTNLGPKSGINVQTAKDVQVAIFAGSNGEIVYLGAAGTLNVTAASNTTGQTFSGTLTNANFVHVDISGNQASPDQDGCMSSMANVSFSGTLMAPQFDGKNIAVHPVLFHRYQ